MAFQVLARKWRPQRFDDVIGQRGVTQTLRNAINAKRIAQSFVFSGPRGVGKTTTARILARALNCEKGPTPDPCGVCDACLEIAQGRDIDVLEIDAATNTQVDKVREVIIAGLGMAPVRDRYKVFIIDEVHRLSNQAFDALLKSIEEPPPHVVFMMATTEIEKVPQTIQSRSQVFELKTISVKQIADQLRRIADAEQISIEDDALMLIARAGDGSMRDAQSAFDQVIAFAGTTITASDVSTVLGLVRRDLLIEIADAVAREDAPAVFELAGRAVEAGYDLRLVIRELARLTRDLLVLSIDSSRVSDPEIAADAERQALLDLSRRFSGEDLMRAFDVLTKAEFDIKAAAQPRYHLEMALLRWIHLGKLTPLVDVISQVQSGAPGGAPSRPGVPQATPGPRPSGAPAQRTEVVKVIESRRAQHSGAAVPPKPGARAAVAEAAPEKGAGDLKDRLLEDIRKQKKFFYGTVVAQAQRIDVDGDRIVFVFGPQHRALRTQLEQNRPWLEETASQLAGKKVAVVSSEGGGTPSAAGGPPSSARADSAGTVEASKAPAAAGGDPKQALKERALSDAGVQTMLDVFAAEIKDVEEMK
jgi:DNA polymerase-3 subunit gamma/tau